MKYIEDKNIRAVLFDLDGTIYYGSKLIPGADEVVRRCRELGKQVYFMTNNSTKTRKQIWEKLTGMGLACSYEDVYTGSYAAALYAHQMGYKTVYIMGSDALAEEFAGLGVTVSDHAEVVIVGYDMDFNYQKLTDALQVALRADKIIACNLEHHYPGENAKRMPGCGAMVGALEGSLGRKVDYSVGKPNPLLMDIICQDKGLKPEEIIVVGDTYASDIVMAHKYGSRAVYIGEEYHEDTNCVRKISELLQ